MAITAYARLRRELLIFKVTKDFYVKARDWREAVDKHRLSGDWRIPRTYRYDIGTLCAICPVYPITHTDTRDQNYRGLLETFARLRDLINCNIDDVSNVLWITLTYAANVQDTKKLHFDFKNFWKRFKRYCIDEFGLEPKYISVVEPQERGSWHIHLLAFFDTVAPFVPSDDLWKMWSPKGYKQNRDYVKIKSLYKDGKAIDNVGAYLTAYLTDTYSENDHKKHKYERLKYYPAGMNYYRCSQGLKRPQITYTSNYRANKKAGFAEPTFSKSITVETDRYTNEFQSTYYNTKRK